jgi:hypothetical protein
LRTFRSEFRVATLLYIKQAAQETTEEAAGVEAREWQDQQRMFVNVSPEEADRGRVRVRRGEPEVGTVPMGIVEP